jgi:hypothetical protein
VHRRDSRRLHHRAGVIGRLQQAGKHYERHIRNPRRLRFEADQGRELGGKSGVSGLGLPPAWLVRLAGQGQEAIALLAGHAVQREQGGDVLAADVPMTGLRAAPRRFALGLLDVQRDDGVVVGWGLDFGDEAIVYAPTDGLGQRLFRVETADRARRLLARRAVRLIWLDPPSSMAP